MAQVNRIPEDVLYLLRTASSSLPVASELVARVAAGQVPIYFSRHTSQTSDILPKWKLRATTTNTSRVIGIHDAVQQPDLLSPGTPTETATIEFDNNHIYMVFTNKAQARIIGAIRAMK